MSDPRPTNRPAELDCIDPLLEQGFLQIPILALQLYPELSSGAVLYYGVLLHYMWRRVDYPGHDVVAAEWPKLARRSITRYMRELKTAGLIQLDERRWGEPLKITLIEGRAQLRLHKATLAPCEAKVARLKGQSGPTRRIDSVETRKDERKDAAATDCAVLIRQLAEEFAPDEEPESIELYLSRFTARRLERSAEITRRATIPANVARIAYLYGVVKRLRDTDADDEQPTTPERLDDEPLSDADRIAATDKLASVRADLERRGVVRPKVPGGGRVRAPGES